jgi:hypothetical protein
MATVNSYSMMVRFDVDYLGLIPRSGARNQTTQTESGVYGMANP